MYILDDGLAGDGVGVSVLHREGAGAGVFIGLERLIVAAANPIVMRGMGFILGEIDRAADVLNLTDGYATVKQRSDAAQRVLAHTVAEQVGARIDEDRTADTVLPVVVMLRSGGWKPQSRR